MIAAGVCDLVSLSRPLICEPNLVNLWKDDIEYTAKCGSCNGCFVNIMKDKGYVCVVNKK